MLGSPKPRRLDSPIAASLGTSLPRTTSTAIWKPSWISASSKSGHVTCTQTAGV